MVVTTSACRCGEERMAVGQRDAEEVKENS
jgi:hypothetical protein